jgi:hypothetical protein
VTNHTPGPWREMSAEIEGADGSKIGQLYARPEDNETWGPGVADANSRLVCAAPDLLDALQALVEAFDADLHDLMIAKLAAQASIAQATGGAK